LLIRIRAATVTAGDCELRSLKLAWYFALPVRMYVGLKKPTRVNIPGMEFSGEVEAAAKSTRRFKPGDAVFGMTGFRMGAYAEYICLPEDPTTTEGVLALKPANLSFEQAAGVPLGGLEALHFLRQAHLQPGEKVLINGAGGSIGVMAVQIALNSGVEVTAVDSAAKLEMLRSIGAHHVLDYTREDFTQNGQAYDVIFDVAGKSPFSPSLRSLVPGGRYLLGNPSLAHRLRAGWTSKTTGKQVIVGSANHRVEDLLFLKAQVEAGAIKPFIDRVYPLEQIVAAHRYVETGAKKGSVVIRIGSES
jgi:NADPH:quinone reductase-like Zn-dependent oxidoreductase